MIIEVIFENLEVFTFDEDEFEDFYLGDIHNYFEESNRNGKVSEIKKVNEVHFTLKKSANFLRDSGFGGEKALPIDRMLKFNDICCIRLDKSEEKDYYVAWSGEEETNYCQSVKLLDNGNLYVSILNKEEAKDK